MELRHKLRLEKLDSQGEEINKCRTNLTKILGSNVTRWCLQALICESSERTQHLSNLWDSTEEQKSGTMQGLVERNI